MESLYLTMQWDETLNGKSGPRWTDPSAKIQKVISYSLKEVDILPWILMNSVEFTEPSNPQQIEDLL